MQTRAEVTIRSAENVLSAIASRKAIETLHPYCMHKVSTERRADSNARLGVESDLACNEI